MWRRFRPAKVFPDAVSLLLTTADLLLSVAGLRFDWVVGGAVSSSQPIQHLAEWVRRIQLAT